MSKILNTTLLAFFVFFACFCWVYYLTKLGSTAIASGAVLAVATVCLCATKRMPKKCTNKKIAKQLALQFALYGDNGVVENLYQFVGYDVDKVDGKLIAKKDKNKHLVWLAFELKDCSATSIVNACKTAYLCGCEQVDFWCKGVNNQVAKYLDLLPVKLKVIDCQKAVVLLEKYQKLPPIKVEKRVNETPVLQYAFSKKRTKSYLASSAFAFALSFLSYWPLYNLVWASFFAVAGLYSRYNKRFNLKEQNISL